MATRKRKPNPNAPQLGNEYRAVLRYAQEFSVNPSVAGAAVTQQFRVNSLFDPDFTGVGHQPMGFDQLMALYNRYLVYGVAYEIIMNFEDNTAARQAIVGHHLNLSSSTTTDWTQYAENPFTEIQMLENIGGSKSQAVFKGYIDIAKIYGMKKSEIETEANFWGQATTNPTQLVFHDIFAAGANATDTAPVRGLVRYTFYCKMHQFNLQPAS